MTLRLADALVDLDQPVCVMAGGKKVFEGVVPRSFATLVQSLEERADLETAATAQLTVQW